MSTKFVLILLTVYVVLADLPRCTIYKEVASDEKSCSRSEVNDTTVTMYVKKCPANEYCKYTFPIAPAKPESCTKSLPLKHIGEYCINKTVCLSNICTDNICRGITGACKNTDECDVGYYCGLDRNCRKLIEEGHECDENNPCELHSVCNRGTCVKAGSLSDNTEADVSSACESFYIDKGRCQKGPKLMNKNYLCTVKEPKCIYKDHNKTEFTTDCSCGVNDKGNSYCSPGKGDIDPKPVNYKVTQ